MLAGCGDTATTAPAASPTSNSASLTAPQPATVTATQTGATSQASPVAPTTVAATTTVPASPTPAQVATPSATTSQPAKFPGKIVYSTDAPEMAVYLINPDSSQRQKLANGSGPVFSPDGQRVAYREVSPEQGGEENVVAIKSVRLDGSDKQIYCTLGVGTGMLLRWSPNGQFIASTRWQTGPGNVTLCDVQTKKNNSFATTGQPANIMIFDWSLDNTTAIWQTVTSSNPLTAELFYGDPAKNGTAVTKLTSGQYRPKYAADTYQYYTAARVSPDGKTIAVAGSRLFFLSVPGQNSPLNGKFLEKLGEVYQIAWSPDGRALAAAVCKESIADGCNRRSLVVVDLNNSQFTSLADDIFSLDWSRQ